MSKHCSAIAGYFRLDQRYQYLRGWIYDRNTPNTSQWIEILIGDRVIASIEACLLRGDLLHLGTGYTSYGFEFLFSDWPIDTNEIELIAVRHRDTGIALRGNTNKIRPRSIAYQNLAVCGLGDLSHYEVSTETHVTSIESNTWVGDSAYTARLLGLHLDWDNRRANMQQAADGQWQYQKTTRHFCFPKATVIMPFGIVIVDNQVVSSSLMQLNETLVSPVLSPSHSARQQLAQPQKDTSTDASIAGRQFALRMVDESVEYIDQPALLMSTPGYKEYFHWHIDVLPMIASLDRFPSGNPPYILCAMGSSNWHRDSLQLVRDCFPHYDYRLYGELKILRVRELLYSSGLGGRGAFLSSDLVPFYEKLLTQCPMGKVPDGIGKRLYLSRKAQLRRPMRNETEIEALVRSRGFSVIDPENYSYQQQISIFRQAETIVSPHGAGLTNLLYCPAGVNVIELFGDAYINRGLQRLANLKKARYGYIVGKSKKQEGLPGRHGFSYEIPAPELNALIDLFDA